MLTFIWYLIWRIFWPFTIHSDILFDAYSDIFLSLYLQVYLTFQVWHSFSHLIWHSIWHFIWYLIWCSIWHSIWQSIWHSIWHFIWQSLGHLIWHCVIDIHSLWIFMALGIYLIYLTFDLLASFWKPGSWMFRSRDAQHAPWWGKQDAMRIWMFHDVSVQSWGYPQSPITF